MREFVLGTVLLVGVGCGADSASRPAVQQSSTLTAPATTSTETLAGRFRITRYIAIGVVAMDDASASRFVGTDVSIGASYVSEFDQCDTISFARTSLTTEEYTHESYFAELTDDDRVAAGLDHTTLTQWTGTCATDRKSVV